jgi:CBS domain-containing protein/GNAT superfamily N-acetyltransferase
MYLAYQPRNSFQGLPPLDDAACKAWVNHMIGEGINLVALSFSKGVVGHTALFPVDDRVCEFLVVVCPELQNTGIGTRLTRCAAQLAYETGFDGIRLDVEAKNARARHVYKKCGFEYLGEKDPRELEMALALETAPDLETTPDLAMALDLKRYHEAVHSKIDPIVNPEVVSIREDASCAAAAKLFLDKRVASLPVVDRDNKLVGIISEMDLMVPWHLNADVRYVLTRDVVSVHHHCTIAAVLQLFQSTRVRCIPVLDDQSKLVGIVSRKDILAYYRKQFVTPSSTPKPD